LCSDGARRGFFHFGLWLVSLLFDNRRGGGCGGLVAILRQRFAGKQDGFFGSVAGSGRSGVTRALRALRAAIVKAALLWTAWLETAGLLTARLKSTGILRALLAALRRRVLRRGKIAASGTALRASTAISSTAAAPAATTATVSAAPAALWAAVVAFAAAIGTAIGTGRIFLRGIVLVREILRGGGVRLRLALFGSFRVCFVMFV
jgi:hypothetical protein